MFLIFLTSTKILNHSRDNVARGTSLLRERRMWRQSEHLSALVALNTCHSFWALLSQDCDLALLALRFQLFPVCYRSGRLRAWVLRQREVLRTVDSRVPCFKYAVNENTILQKVLNLYAKFLNNIFNRFSKFFIITITI